MSSRYLRAQALCCANHSSARVRLLAARAEAPNARASLLHWAAGVLAMTAGPILYFAALHLVFVSSVRYRLPGEYPMLILSAVGWEVLLLRGRFKRWLGPDNTAVI